MWSTRQSTSKSNLVRQQIQELFTWHRANHWNNIIIPDADLIEYHELFYI
jgi:hypothetical protein